MVKKYEITSDCKTVDNVKVCRIKALKDIPPGFYEVKKGDLGGFIEKEDNLSQEDRSWVKGNAVVTGNARVEGDAKVDKEAFVGDNAVVKGEAWVKGNAVVKGEAMVEDNAVVNDNAVVSGNAWVGCATKLFDSVKVSGGKVCASEDIVFDSQKKLDDYLEDIKKI